MVDGDQVPALDAAWREFTGDTAATFADVARAARREVLLDAFGSELRRLVGLALAAGAGEEPGVWPALVELIAAFPVYRSYRVPDEPPGEADRQAIEHACRVARAQLEAHGGEQREQALASLDSLAAALLGRPAHAAGWEFVARFQQLTAPVAAKGVEDTAIYRFPRMASVNGVGGDPDLIGISVDRFPQACERRLADWPDAMLATWTHDHKAREDGKRRLPPALRAPARRLARRHAGDFDPRQQAQRGRHDAHRRHQRVAGAVGDGRRRMARRDGPRDRAVARRGRNASGAEPERPVPADADRTGRLADTGATVGRRPAVRLPTRRLRQAP